MQTLNLAFSAGATVATAALVSPRFAGSLALGAVLEAVNFRSLRRAGELSVRAQLGEPDAGATGLVLASFGARFAMLAIAIGVALYAGAHPVGLVAGLSMIVPAALIAAWRVRPVDVPAQENPNPPLAADDPEWDRWNSWLAREREEEDEEGES